MIEVAVCDDEQLFVDEISNLLQKYADKHELSIQIKKFTQPEAFLSTNLSTYTLVFLDGNMPTHNGIDVAKRLRLKNETALLVFVSAFVEYAYRGYSVRACGCLLKRELATTFDRCLDEILPQLQLIGACVEISSTDGAHIVLLEHIIFVESFKRQLHFHIGNENAEILIQYAKLSDWQQTLSLDRGFLRIHKSYLINLRHCTKINARVATLSNGTELPCSKQNYAQIVQDFLRGKERLATWNML